MYYDVDRATCTLCTLGLRICVGKGKRLSWSGVYWAQSQAERRGVVALTPRRVLRDIIASGHRGAGSYMQTHAYTFAYYET